MEKRALPLKNKPSYQINNESGIPVPFDYKHLKKVLGIFHMKEAHRVCHIEVVFVDDEEILQLNRKYLNHDYITDIITFPYHEHGDDLEGTLYCCATQILRQARSFQESFNNELIRVVIHGLLHLAGYDDQTKTDLENMRKLENLYIKHFWRS